MDLACELSWKRGEAPDFETVPDSPGVLLLLFEEGPPYLARTAALRRRLKRLLQPPDATSSRLNLREATRQALYQPTGSAFESALLLYRLACRHRPDDYRRYLKLRRPPFVKVHLNNPYPRTYVTTRLTRRRALFFGPFASRASAEKFESAFLDLYKIRRCHEDLTPDPGHPGCIYGEMDMCLRPCQARSTLEEYRGEVGHVLEFLHTNGQSLIRMIEQERDRTSTELAFEEASRHHKRLQKVQEALKLKDELARDIDRLFGFVIQPSVADQAVELWMLFKGSFQPQLTFRFAAADGRPVSLDKKLREAIDSLHPATVATQERGDHLALLNRWYQSSWRSGELVLFERVDRIPYRRLVNAISRVAAGGAKKDLPIASPP